MFKINDNPRKSLTVYGFTFFKTLNLDLKVLILPRNLFILLRGYMTYN